MVIADPGLVKYFSVAPASPVEVVLNESGANATAEAVASAFSTLPGDFLTQVATMLSGDIPHSDEEVVLCLLEGLS